MAKLIVVVGLPGSGKTIYLNSLKAAAKVDEIYDDYQGQSYDTSGDPHLSKNYGPLLAALKQGKRVAVADIIFCVETARQSFLGAVFEVVPEVTVEFCYFENKPELCMRNVENRARSGRIEKELEFIKTHSPKYRIPRLLTLDVKHED